METIECIKKRRSRRLFSGKEVSQELIYQLLDCALHAPSARNGQPWHFIVVSDKDIKRKLAELKDEQNRQHMLTAPVLIIVCADAEKSPGHVIEDCVVAAQNILLAAHDLGLGSVYVTGLSKSDPNIEKEIKNILSIPENIIPAIILPIGFPDPSEKLHERSIPPLLERMHVDKW